MQPFCEKHWLTPPTGRLKRIEHGWCYVLLRAFGDSLVSKIATEGVFSEFDTEQSTEFDAGARCGYSGGGMGSSLDRSRLIGFACVAHFIDAEGPCGLRCTGSTAQGAIHHGGSNAMMDLVQAPRCRFISSSHRGAESEYTCTGRATERARHSQ